MAPTSRRPIALVHDYLLVMRGAERTFAEIAACWPEAPIYTLLYDRGAVGDQFGSHAIHASYLQRLGVRQRGFRYLLPLFPRAAEHLSVEDYDVVVSSSSAFAHGGRPRPGALHVCYCHSPFRYAWFERDRALAETPGLARPLMRRTLNRIHKWDLDAARRVTTCPLRTVGPEADPLLDARGIEPGNSQPIALGALAGDPLQVEIAFRVESRGAIATQSDDP